MTYYFHKLITNFLIILLLKNCNAEYLNNEISTCGSNSIPFALTVDFTSHPELFCDVPSCFLQNDKKVIPLNLNQAFHKPTDLNSINYLKKKENKINFDLYKKKPIENSLLQRYRRQNEFFDISKYNVNNVKKNIFKIRKNIKLNNIAKCSGNLKNTACSGRTDWTGSIGEWNNGTHISLMMECCHFDDLIYAKKIKTVVLEPGQKYEGGEIILKKNVVAFDLIKEIRKNVTENNELVCVDNKLNKAENFFNKNNENKLQSDRGRASASMLRLAMNKKRLLSQNYLQRIKMAKASASESPKLNNFSQFFKYRKIKKKLESSAEKRRHPSIQKLNFEDTNTLNSNGSSFTTPVSIDDEYFYYDINDDLHNTNIKKKELGLLRLSSLAPKHKLKSKIFLTPQSFDSEMLQPTETDSEILETRTSSSIFAADPKNLESKYKSIFDEQITALSNQPIPAVQEGYQTLNTYLPSSSDTSPLIYIDNNYQSPPETISESNSIEKQCPTTCNAQQSTVCTQTSSCCCSSVQDSFVSSLQCFSGDLLVQTRDYGMKRIDELEIGDFVLTIEHSLATFSPIIMFLHRKPEETAIYWKILTKNNQTLKLTKYHLIYTSKCENPQHIDLVHAYKLIKGNCLYVLLKHDINNYRIYSSKIVQITKIVEKGIYAPLTANGDIVVNEVLVSCHSNVVAQTLQQTFFSWLRIINNVIFKIFSIFNLENQYFFIWDLMTTFGKFTNVFNYNVAYLFKTNSKTFFLNTDTKFSNNNKSNYSFFKKTVIQSNFKKVNNDIPFGVEYLVNVLDLFVPISAF